MINTSQIPYGYCHCGCGQKTKISTRNDRRAGAIKGEPFSSLMGITQRSKSNMKLRYEDLTTEQLKALLDVRSSKNVDYDIWRELHLLGLVSVNMEADDNSPVQDILTDDGLTILGALAHG